ncbi:hypothetical protein [Gallaecimonas sp. GXIMD4217]|uniref:hypothetical protein n=1 Tax=Gallaecimonas sp. GXIMD4217 TaxID=3131927 RepID=UPI00311B1D49
MEQQIALNPMVPPQPLAVPKMRLFSPMQMALCAFIGGPLGACWLMAQNFGALGYFTLKSRARTWALISTLLVAAASLFLRLELPGPWLAAIYTLSVAWCANHYQGEAYAEHQLAGGETQNWVWVILISLVSAAVTLAVFSLLFFVTPYQWWG